MLHALSALCVLLAIVSVALAIGLVRARRALTAALLAVPVAAPGKADIAEPKALEGPAPVDPRGTGRPSMEPHIDADQRAEFLMVLGQDQAAIDLLLEHLRGSGGSSPLAYLRLMQLYRGRSDGAAYERTRERFNQRFNASAPQWHAGADQQRTLEAYPSVLADVQAAWAQPERAMSLVEALLFRRGTEGDRFDLPAYEDLLLLYWLTRDLQRDLHDQQHGQQGREPSSSMPKSLQAWSSMSVTQVDILLPLDEGMVDASVIERGGSYDSTAVFTQMAVDRRPASVDLDLDLGATPPPPPAPGPTPKSTQRVQPVESDSGF